MTEPRTQGELPGSDFHLLKSTIADEEFEVSVATLRRADGAGKRLPVVYMPDANSLFAMVTTTAAAMMIVGELPEMIVVGIGHPVGGAIWTDLAALQEFFKVRARHLTPTEIEVPEEKRTAGGGAEKFLGFIREELIPIVDANYPTNPEDRTLVGHSLGGLFSVYALFQHPETFNRYVAGSPSLGWGDGVVLQHEREFAESHSSLPVKLFMSVASHEGPTETGVEEMAETLKSRNYSGLEVTFERFEDETHMSVIGHTFSRGLRAVFSGG